MLSGILGYSHITIKNTDIDFDINKPLSLDHTPCTIIYLTDGKH